MSQTELLHTFKMMGVLITPEELRSLQELLPSSAISKEGNIDYRELFWILQTQPSRGTSFYPEIDGSGLFPPKGFAFSPNRLSTPTNYTPIPLNNSRFIPDLETVGFDRSMVSTPIGTYVSTPLKPEHRDPHSTIAPSKRELPDLLSKVKVAIAEKCRDCGANYHIQKQFEAFDGDLTGFVSLLIFQRILEELSVSLSSSDIYLIKSRYSPRGDERIDYLQFCHDLNSAYENYTNPSLSRPTLGSRALTPETFFPTVTRLSETLRRLRNSGRDPRDIFQAYDLDNTGMVKILFFSE